MYKMRLNISHEVYLEREDIVKALEMERKNFLRGDSAIVEKDGKMVYVRYGTGSHHYSHDEYGREASVQEAEYYSHLVRMIQLLEDKEKFLAGEEI